jgi:hypothetical protein
MRRLRIRIRTLLIAVALIGLACGADVMRKRRVEYLDRAMAWQCIAEDLCSPHDPRIDEHCDQLRRKYERAARYPWLPVAPDPPPPE